MMQAKDLSELIYSNLYRESIQAINQNGLSINLYSQAEIIDDLLSKVKNTEDSAYLGALLLLKLDRVSPSGAKVIPMLQKACNAIITNTPQLIPSMNYYASSIIVTEIMKSHEESVISWIETINYLSRYEGARDAPRSAANTRLAMLFWSRATRIHKNTTEEFIMETLYMLNTGRNLGFSLEDASKIITRSVIDFIEQRNCSGRKNKHTSLARDYEMLVMIKNMNIKCELLGNNIARLEQLFRKSEELVFEKDLIFSYQKDDIMLASACPIFLNEDLVQVDVNKIQIGQYPLYSRQIIKFQVSIYEATYYGSPAAIKMYKDIVREEDFHAVQREIKCNQFLSRRSKRENCFLQCYGCYVQGNSLNIVMEYYKKDLMQVITEMRNSNSEFREELLLQMFKKLLESYSEMEALGIFHGNIKPHNILKDDFGNMKITDFSVSVVKITDIAGEVTGINPVQGASGYMAPELIELQSARENVGICSPERSDIFSLGLVFLQLLTLRELSGLNTIARHAELMTVVRSLKFEWSVNLLRGMLMLDYRQRPRFTDCLQYVALQSENSRLEEIGTNPGVDLPSANSLAPNFIYKADNQILALTTHIFSAERINYIDASEIKIITQSFFARRTDHFQVAVHKASYMGQTRAIKMYEAISPTKDFAAVETEIKCYQYLSRMSNSNNCFLKYYGTYCEENSFNLVMDYYEKDLMMLITEKAAQPHAIHEQTIAGIFIKLLTSFAEMEAVGIFHGDIKPHNILTDNNWNMKIIDFNVSVTRNTELTTGITGKNPLQGTEGYMAPELKDLVDKRENIGFYSPERSDVFSLGMVFLQILTLEKLEGLNTFANNATLLNKVDSLKYDWAKRLLAPMLVADYTNRPRFKDCFQYIGKTMNTRTMSNK